uniref:Adiponectin receptor protein n=1 Tax=Acrobeloides nanus TaxID=290746 RepID=A0A914CVY6_9BILA
MSQKALWTIKDDKENIEIRRGDESQVIADVDESNVTGNSNERTFNRRRWRAWTLLHFDHLPVWLQDNEFLRTRHRPPLQSVMQCLKSIFSFHSETGNIWTHLLGCVAFIALATWFLCRPGSWIIVEEKVVFSFFFLGAILCLGLSCTYHTMNCHSQPVSKVFQKLDYVGIALLIIGSFIPWIYYAFYCRIAPKISYISMIAVLGLLAIIVSLCEKFAEYKYRPLRATVFVAMGLSAMVPVFHFLITDGFLRLINEGGFYWLSCMAFLYLFGAMIYATRTPERFCPGKFDLWLHSHQLFHMCVVCAALVHYVGITKMAQLRLKDSCSNATVLATDDNVPLLSTRYFATTMTPF